MYGQYKEDLAKFARTLSTRRSRRSTIKSNAAVLLQESSFLRTIYECLSIVWKYSLGIIGGDWPFLALLGITMAIISFVVDFFILQCHQTRMILYDQIFTQNLMTRYLGWILLPILLLIFATGVVNIISPQAIGSGIPEMKTILRGVILHEYLSFRTLIAKLIGLACSLGSGLPLGKEGPFVHTGSMVATVLSKMIGSFTNDGGRRSNNIDARTKEMLAAACAVGVATTFYSPIGGVLFSVEVTTDFFAIRNYWRGFFSACCAATVWRLFAVWFRKEAALTSLFKTNFRTDFPFDPQELLVFAFIGVGCGFGGAAYVRCHRYVVHFVRNQKTLNTFLKKNRFIYPTLITFILMSVSFPPFMGQYMASILSNPQTFQELFSNITWNNHLGNNQNDSHQLTMTKHWTTSHTNIFMNLIITIINTFWMSILASTIPVPSGLFVPLFKIGAVFGRLVGEIMAFYFPDGISFSGQTIPIVPGGYSVVGAAAFVGAVTHTISIAVIVFEMTGQMSHLIPVILSVLIANAISQKLELSIYDSVIQIKKLPFLPPIKVTNNRLAHHIYIDDIMIRDFCYIHRKNFTYRNLLALLVANPTIRTFPLVDSRKNMLLLGSIKRAELERMLNRLLCHERRLQIRRSSGQLPQRFFRNSGSDDDDDDDSIQFIRSDDERSEMSAEDKRPLYPQQPSLPTSRSVNRFDVSLVTNSGDQVKGQDGQHGHDGAGHMAGGHEGQDGQHGQDRESSADTTDGQKSPQQPKSILKQSFTVTSYPVAPHLTIQMHSTINKDSRLRQVFEDIFQKSLHLKDAHPTPAKSAETLTGGSENGDRSGSDQQSIHKVERKVRLPRERIIDMTIEEQRQWEEEQLNMFIEFNDNNCHIDTAPFQLVERTTIYRVHLLFSMLSLSRAYITSIGRLVGIINLADLKNAIDKLNQGLLQPREYSSDRNESKLNLN